MRFGAGFELVSIVKKLVAKPVLDNSTDDTITHHRAHRSVEAKRAVAAMASPSRRRGDAGTLLREPRRRRRLKLPLLARRKRHEVHALEALVGPVGHGADADGEDRVERLPAAEDASG